MGNQVSYGGVENLEVMQEAENYNRYLFNLIRRHALRGSRIIDFGAGSGTFAIPLAALGFDVTAIEPDDGLRGRLRANDVRTASGPAELADESYDYAFSLNVLEHIPDDAKALRQLRQKLAPGALLLIYVPAFPILYTSMDARVGHVRRYTRRGLAASVESAGFGLEESRYVDSIGFAATLLFRLVGNASGEINRPLLKLYDRIVFPLSRGLDFATRRWFGKNLMLLARKPLVS